VAASVACHGVWGEAEAHVAGQLAGAAADVDQTGKAIAGVRADLDAAHATLRASRSIAEQPDWSAVMALLAAKAGPDVALRGCTVRPKDPEPQQPKAPQPKDPKKSGAKTPARPEPPPEPVMVLTVSGLGKTQFAVSQFALRLEATGLFARVSLIETNREAFEKGEAIAFRVECSLDAPAREVAESRSDGVMESQKGHHTTTPPLHHSTTPSLAPATEPAPARQGPEPGRATEGTDE
jgi:hypothetical protein